MEDEFNLLVKDIRGILYKISIRGEIVDSRKDPVSGRLSEEGKKLLNINYKEIVLVRDKIKDYNDRTKTDYFKKTEATLNEEISNLERMINEV